MRRMGVVARGAILDDPLARPMSDTLTMGATGPVLFLSEVTLSAHLVAMVHVDFSTRFGYQEVACVFFMTGVA